MCKLQAQINSFLQSHPEINQYIIAYSGGVDSHVLLHLFKNATKTHLAFSVKAVHIHHGLQANADNWVSHCETTCKQLSIELKTFYVDATPASGESTEAKARTERYRSLMDGIDAKTCVVTGHNQDDQAETFLLQLMRGAGPKGLAAMPNIKAFADGVLARPLLSTSRNAIVEYAQSNKLKWIDDPSNCHRYYDRNYIRHEIMPKLRERWPSADKTMARSAKHCAENSELVETFIGQYLDNYQGSQLKTLSIEKLLSLSRPERNQLIRQWIEMLGHLMPSTVQLDQIENCVLLARQDASPVVILSDGEIRRYRGNLYLIANLSHEELKPIVIVNPNQNIIIGPQKYKFVKHKGRGFQWPNHGDGEIEIKFRSGGETCTPATRKRTHQLKKLLQELGIEPWLRNSIPLLYYQNSLIAVGHYFICEGHQTTNDNVGYTLQIVDES